MESQIKERFASSPQPVFRGKARCTCVGWCPVVRCHLVSGCSLCRWSIINLLGKGSRVWWCPGLFTDISKIIQKFMYHLLSGNLYPVQVPKCAIFRQRKRILEGKGIIVWVLPKGCNWGYSWFVGEMAEGAELRFIGSSWPRLEKDASQRALELLYVQQVPHNL